MCRIKTRKYYHKELELDRNRKHMKKKENNLDQHSSVYDMKTTIRTINYKRLQANNMSIMNYLWCCGVVDVCLFQTSLSM